jgi:hypothetical protein
MKERLVFEIFKERLEKQYTKTFYARMGEAKNKENIYAEMRKYCENVKADYREVLKLADKLRKDIFLKEKSKRLNMSEKYLEKENYRKVN